MTIGIPRPGLDPSWIKSWESQSNNILKTRDELELANRRNLEYFAQTGIPAQPLEYPAKDANPPRKNWERFLASDLAMYANVRGFEFENKGLIAGIFDAELAAMSFASAYMAELIDINIHDLFPRRFPGRTLRNLNLKMVAFTALGVVLGTGPKAFQLALAQRSSYEKGFYFADAYYPIFVFILRLLADFLNAPPLTLKGEPRAEPIFNALFDSWRAPDVEGLGEICLAACDFHTHRCRVSKGDEFHEFDTGAWMRMPIEILLLFKLRKMSELEIPVLDHPLMNTALGVLPPEVGFKPDNLITRVRNRMELDGYNEDAILEIACAMS